MPAWGDPWREVERARERGDVPGLLRLLGHRDAGIRDEAAWALRELTHERPDLVTPAPGAGRGTVRPGRGGQALGGF